MQAATLVLVAFALVTNWRQYVLQGTNGWLYYRETLQCFVKKLPDNTSAISKADSVCKSAGTRLTVVTVPSSIEVYPEYLLHFDPPIADIWWARSGIVKRIRSAGVDYIDLLPAFREEKKKSVLYEKLDTHWSSAASCLSAKIVAEHLNAAGLSGPNRYRLKDSTAQFNPDLYRIKFDNDTFLAITPIRVVVPETISDDSSRILVIGDSHTALFMNSNAHFAAHVELYTGCKVDCFRIINGGVLGFEKLKELLNKGVLRKYKRVVWIFADRAFMFPFETE